jgi:hypothetical protein
MVVDKKFVVKENLLVDLSYQFALRITSVAAELRRSKEYDLASQLWRSGTSISANIEEAQAAQSQADFRSKMSIAAKKGSRKTRLAKARKRRRPPKALLNHGTDCDEQNHPENPHHRRQIQLQLTIKHFSLFIKHQKSSDFP